MVRIVFLISVLLIILQMPVFPAWGQGQERADVIGFAVSRFEIFGNTKLTASEIARVLRPYVGEEKTAEDVEKARTDLERYYHQSGYPTVLVNIPEQTVEEGVVQLEVIESKIRRVKITGNRYFTMESIRKKLPSFQPGEVLYLPKIQAELAEINRNPDLKVAPVLIPGAKAGTIDVELQVKDRLPLHGSVELNNRASHNTTDLRMNALIRYDNLWQKEHSISLQFQTAPQDTEEVQAIAASYVLPAPWNPDRIMALYGVWSDSNVAFGEGFNTVGKGVIFGGRYVIPLSPKDMYNHSVSVGIDYKDFDEKLGFEEGGEDLVTPLTYAPLSFSYNGSLPDKTGVTRFSAGLNMAFRGLVGDEEEFLVKRFKSRGNYIYALAGVERQQKLPWNLELFVKADGQIADQPLPSNEQYSAGGMESVRGYMESEVLGDNAYHGTIEFAGPEVFGFFDLAKRFQFKPYIFWDYAAVSVIDALPGQDENAHIAGTGVGARGFLTRWIEYQVDYGVALEDTDQVEKGDQMIHFMVKTTW